MVKQFITIFTLFLTLSIFSQTEDIVSGHLKRNPDEKLHFMAVVEDFAKFNNSIIFVTEKWGNDIKECYAKIYHPDIKKRYTSGGFGFKISEIDTSRGDKVVSLFFENIDNDPYQEMIVIVVHYTRTFYNDGGYSGYHPIYTTRVYDSEEKVPFEVKEYRTIGNMLTKNAPFPMGTKKEEELIGRDLYNVDDIYGVTKRAEVVRKLIVSYKKHGLLGGLRNKNK